MTTQQTMTTMDTEGYDEGGAYTICRYEHPSSTPSCAKKSDSDSIYHLVRNANMKGSRAIALRRGLVQSRPRTVLATASRATPITPVSTFSSRSVQFPVTGLSGNVRWHSTSPAGPSGQLSTSIPGIAPADSYDIVIIGAANAGLALACSLRRSSSFRSA